MDQEMKKTGAEQEPAVTREGNAPDITGADTHPQVPPMEEPRIPAKEEPERLSGQTQEKTGNEEMESKAIRKTKAQKETAAADAAVLPTPVHTPVKEKSAKSRKKWILGIGIPVAVLLVLYVGISIFFMNSFLYGTTINGVDCFGSSPEKVSAILASGAQDYVLTISEREDQSEEIRGEQLGLSWDFSGQVQEFLEEQSPFAWPALLMDHRDYTIEPLVAYDEEKLTETVEALSCLEPSQAKAPEDAYIDHTETGFTFVEEVAGTTVDKGRLMAAVADAVKNSVTQLSLEEQDCYVNPAITLDSPEIKVPREDIEKWLATRITYQFGPDQEVLDQETIHSWISVDENNQAVLSEEEIASYVKKLAANHDTVGKNRDFHATGGYTVSVGGGPYGWRIDRAAEREELKKLIEEGTVTEREPVFSQTAKGWGADEIGSTYVEVNLASQHMWYYKNGSLVVETDIVSGKMTPKTATPPLIGFIHYKQRNAVLRGEDYETPVKMWMPVSGGIGIHDALWRKSFGGDIYVNSGSHGCINTPFKAVKTIFEDIEVGTPCVFYYGSGGTPKAEEPAENPETPPEGEQPAEGEQPQG